MAGPTNAGNNPEGPRGSTIRVARRRRRVGLSARGERTVAIVGIAMIAFFAIAWSWSILFANNLQVQQDEPPATHTVATALTTVSAPTAAYVTDAALEALAR